MSTKVGNKSKKTLKKQEPFVYSKSMVFESSLNPKGIFTSRWESEKGTDKPFHSVFSATSKVNGKEKKLSGENVRGSENKYVVQTNGDKKQMDRDAVLDLLSKIRNDILRTKQEKNGKTLGTVPKLRKSSSLSSSKTRKNKRLARRTL